MLHKDLTSKIINCAYQVQKTLGFGFLESVYQNALLHELTKAGLKAQKEQKILVTYDNQIVGNFTADIVVENKIILELKSNKEIHPAHEVQLNNYLKLDFQVFFAEQLDMPVIPGAAERRPGIQEDRSSPWIPVFTGMTKKT
jgi:GxxExxY protein